MRNEKPRALFQVRAGLIAFVTAVYGLLIIADTLFGQLEAGRISRRITEIGIGIDVPLLVGFTLLYLSLFLRRRKRNAWRFAMGVYVFLLGLNTNAFLTGLRFNKPVHFVAALLLPLLMLIILWLARHQFVVSSDTQTFRTSLRITVVVLLTALLYGTVGFILMDKRDFHQEVSLPSAMHYTIDQFDLTTNPLHAYTRRAVLFQDSLTFVSLSALALAVASLFQPLRARYTHQKERYEQARELVYAHSKDSEDFFKLWPHDKAYFFSSSDRAGFAYKVQRGVALVVGNPMGERRAVKRLLQEFEDFCFSNDWRPAFIHTTSQWKAFFTEQGYQHQLIGQEALVDLEAFERLAGTNKYFKEIDRRFTKHGYTTEFLQPPHHTALLDRLGTISGEWLERPGREERRFMMGYFSEPYLQQCTLVIARDAAGTIQAFMNVLPSPLPEEADYDMLRSSARALGNINDYLLMQLIRHLKNEGTVRRLNMGLCPLAGLDQEPSTLINRTLRFVYSNGDRFYSFKGLYKFKAKYEPEWSDRFIMYKGGAADFTRIMTALGRAMKM